MIEHCTKPQPKEQEILTFGVSWLIGAMQTWYERKCEQHDDEKYLASKHTVPEDIRD